MPTTWTNSTPTSTVTWNQLEPSGFGIDAFGDPSNLEAGLKIHQRGFGSPTTKWSDYDETP